MAQSQEASHDGERGNAQAYTKIKIQKFLLKALRPFTPKLALPKISRYTVYLILKYSAWNNTT